VNRHSSLFDFVVPLALLLCTAATGSAQGTEIYVDAELYEGGDQVIESLPTLRGDYLREAILLNIVLDPVADVERVGLGSSQGGPLQIGFGRNIPPPYRHEIPFELSSWVPTADAGFRVAFAVTSPEARAIRLGLVAMHMASDIEVRFFGFARPEQIFGPFRAREIARRHEMRDARRATAADVDAEEYVFWSPVIDGDTIGVEIYASSATARDGLSLALPQVSHLELTPSDPASKRLEDIGESLPCHVDVVCESPSNSPRDAVAKIVFTKEGSTFLCSGQLMNDWDIDSRIPYFLTANHCIGTQGVANTVDTYWLFHRAVCGGPDPTSVTQRTGGGELLSTGAASDYTLMQLDADIPNVIFSGWGTAPQAAGTEVFGIHHPAGDLAKISGGTIQGFADRGGPVNGTGSFLRVVWTLGTTESGSSGSGVFGPKPPPYWGAPLRGILSIGYESCTDPWRVAWYGRFDLTHPYVQPWLEWGAILLTSGASLSGAVDQFKSEEYKIRVPSADTAVRVDLTGLSQDVDLYVRRGLRPTLDVWDCRPAMETAHDERCLLPNSGDTTYYIRVLGLDSGTTSFTINATSGTAIDVIFADGFESGDTSAWLQTPP